MRLLSCFLALTLSTSAVLAADVSPLSPGHPAGVKRAQAENNTPLYVLGGAAVLIGIAFGISSRASNTPASGGSSVTTTTTGTTA